MKNVFSVEDMIKFTSMKVVDLKSELKANGITGFSKMKKAELQEKVLSIWESEREAEVADEEEVKELKYRIEDLEYELEQRDEEIGELSEQSHYIRNNMPFVKKMMKDLAKIYHPDKCGNTEDMIKLNEFKEAFCLSDKTVEKFNSIKYVNLDEYDNLKAELVAKDKEVNELKAEIENLKAWNKDLQECINDDVSSFYATRTDDYIDKMFEEHDKHIREFAEEAQRLAIGIAEDGFFIPVKGNENKIKKWLKDSAKMYHPDKPTGDTEMMMFINDLREINKKSVSPLT